MTGRSILLALLAGAMSACATAEEATVWAEAEAALDCEGCEAETVALTEALEPAAERPPADESTRRDRTPDGIGEQVCSNNDLVWYEYCPQ